MRLYMNVRLSNKQDTFLPQDLYLATENTDDTDVISEDCIRLSGIECESSPAEDNLFSVRWKGVTLETAEQNFEENFSLDTIKKLIADKKLIIRNMAACYDKETTAVIENAVLETEYGKLILSDETSSEPIEFVA